MQNRWNSKVLWVSILALFYFVLKEWVGFEIPNWDMFVELLLGALVALGVINNPTDKNNL